MAGQVGSGWARELNFVELICAVERDVFTGLIWRYEQVKSLCTTGDSVCLIRVVAEGASQVDTRPAPCTTLHTAGCRVLLHRSTHAQHPAP